MKLYELPRDTKLRVDVTIEGEVKMVDATFHRTDGMYSYCTLDDWDEENTNVNGTFHLAAWTPMKEVDGRWEIDEDAEKARDEEKKEAREKEKGPTDMVGTRITPGCVVAYAVRSGNSGAMKVGVVADPDNYKVISIVDQYGHRRISQKGTLYDWSRTVVVPYEIIEDQEILNLIADARERIFA